MSILPARGRGNQSIVSIQKYETDLKAFADLIKQIESTLDFRISSRGWGYQLEDHGLLKSEFDKASDLINDCRKCGLLPMDICIEDQSRSFHCEESIAYDVDREIDFRWNIIDSWLNSYCPISVWETQPYFVQMLVEKIDLVSLFKPICYKFNIPIANSRGWSDLNMRVNLMNRFKENELKGKKCVLLYCGDHDPAGLHISTSMRSNLEDLSKAVDWKPDNLIIERFGLNFDFIKENNLTWIDNLISSSGRDLSKPKKGKNSLEKYIADYITLYGVRKVEANALVVRPKEGRKLCEDAVLKYVDTSLIPEYEKRLESERDNLKKEFALSIKNRLAA